MSDYKRTNGQKICDEVRNKPLHVDIAWNQRATTMRELLEQQAQAIKENEENDKS